MSLKDIILDLFGYQEPDKPAPAAPPKREPPKPALAAPKPPPAAAPAARDPGERDEAAVLDALRKAGAQYRRVVFTRNRRIMISVARDRATLRMNAAFARAPEAVLHAVGVMYSSARGKRTAQAKETVRRFLNELPAAPVERRAPRRRDSHPNDRPILERLQGEFDRVNRLSFGGRLPRVPLHLSRKMRRRNGHFSSHPLEIVISHRLCTHGEAGEAEATVRHEMIHLWQYMEGVAVDHGPAFRRLAHKLDVHPRATRPVRWKGR
ncbi:MAG TPA: SprT-like domain-containing protein [Longimicrobium sp.]|nr:SprT-like domain-containing protein [Longimicrobium sp.]